MKKIIKALALLLVGIVITFFFACFPAYTGDITSQLVLTVLGLTATGFVSIFSLIGK